MKYRCEIIGTAYVEAKNEEQALQIAQELNEQKWTWNSIDVEEDE